MKCCPVLLLVAAHICISMAVEVLYVSPDNSTNISCPSQPCATLSQYLLDNGTLPVVSNVEYHFLPAEHHVLANMTLEGLHNFFIIGIVNGKSPVVLIGCSQPYVIKIIDSYFVTITNISFKHCDTTLIKTTSITSLHIVCCLSYTIENVTFLKYGFTGINLIGDSYLHNIHVKAMQFSEQCCQGVFLQYVTCLSPSWDIYKNHTHVVTLNQLFVHNYIKYRTNINIDNAGLFLHLDYTLYNVSILLVNSLFYNMDRPVLQIKSRCSHRTKGILVKNCTFKQITSAACNYIITVLVSHNNSNIKFVNCKFHSNIARLIEVQVQQRNNYECKIINMNEKLLGAITNISFVKCQFKNNSEELLTINNQLQTLGAVNVLFESLNISKNIFKKSIHEGAKIQMREVNVHMKGTLTVIGNVAESSIMKFHLCDIIMSSKIVFDSNFCTEIISLDTYIKVMEHTNITFANNRYQNDLITVESTEKYYEPHPTCLFQYMTINSNVNTKTYQLTTTSLLVKISMFIMPLDYT